MSKGNMLLGYAKGKVGSLVFTRRKGEQITRAYNAKPTNPNTEAQSRQRVQLSNLVSLYRACRALLNHSFTDAKVNQSSYNAFVSANLNSIRVYLTKEAAKANAAVVAPYVVSKGLLPSIQVSGTGENATTNISVGNLTIDAQTTIGAFSQALIDNNANIIAGMQLSYASFVQDTNINTGYPSVLLGLYEITIDVSDQRLLSDYMPEQSIAVRGGFLGHGPLVADGGFCWILSQKNADGKTIASTQRIIVTSSDVYLQWANDAAQGTATRSYDAVSEYYLTPGGGSEVASNTPATPSIASVRVGGSLVSSNSSLSVSAGEEVAVVISGSNLASVDSGSVVLNGSTYTLNSIETTTTQLTAAINVADDITSVTSVRVALNGTTLFSASPTSSQGGGEDNPF